MIMLRLEPRQERRSSRRTQVPFRRSGHSGGGDQIEPAQTRVAPGRSSFSWASEVIVRTLAKPRQEIAR